MDSNRLSELLNRFGNQDVAAIGPLPFLLVMVLSLACAFFVAYLYKRFYGNRETGTQIHRSFPLLGLSITAIFMAIQFSLPLSLGLLGALSIVRFRTPVKEPEEIGFLMVVIACALACATFNFVFLGILLVLALAGVLAQELLFTRLGSSARHGMVLLSLPEAEFGERRGALLAALAEALPKGRFESLSKNDGQVVVAYSFRGLPSDRLAEIEERLTRTAAPSQYSISYQTSGAL
jgi:hypothetical protein